MFEPNIIVMRTEKSPNLLVKKGELYIVSTRTPTNTANINISDVYEHSTEIIGSSLGWRADRFREATFEEISSVVSGLGRTDFSLAHPLLIEGWSWDEKKSTAVHKKPKKVKEVKPKVEWFVEWEVSGTHAMLIHPTRQKARSCKAAIKDAFEVISTGKLVTQLNGKRELIKCPL